METMMSGARFIAETLNGYGVTHVFLVMAILRKTLVELEELNIKRILTHSEKAAAYMADGYARVSRKPGICMAQSVGAANLCAGLQDPFLAHSPVIAITGRKKPIAQYRNAYQEIIHGPMYDAVTKYNVNVDAIEQLPFILSQAFREATTGAPRPVHLDLLGFAGEVIETAEINCAPVIEEQFARYPAYRFSPENEYFNKAVMHLEEAKRPVIIAGGGAIASSAESEILQLAEALSIPVATSNDGKGVIPDNHSLSIGVVGSYSCGVSNELVSKADLVIFIGCSAGDQVTNDWTLPRSQTNIIQIDINPSELGRNFRNKLCLLGDAKTSLQGLLKLIKDIDKKNDWAKHALSEVKDWTKSIECLCRSQAVPIRPERLCSDISNMLPTNAVLVADTGYSAVWASNFVFFSHPNQRFVRAAGSLGWAFPASLGVKCAAPDRPVICFTGDGAFWYHLSELETAKRYGIKTITVINNNSRLAQSVIGVDAAYGARSGKRGELYKFNTIDFAKVATDMGCMGYRIESPDMLAETLREALKADIPVVVDVKTDGSARPPIPWSPPAK
ncbi:MAG: thiamine pyrophosphate-binding protein [Deltaproteobacteria bacterium]|nr:thiamine pyrophosphate-binding protein [Deltaproteobacteria bacterium]